MVLPKSLLKLILIGIQTKLSRYLLQSGSQKDKIKAKLYVISKLIWVPILIGNPPNIRKGYQCFYLGIQSPLFLPKGIFLSGKSPTETQYEKPAFPFPGIMKALTLT